MGAAKYEYVSDTEVIGYHQIRAAHQRYADLDLATVDHKGHGHSLVRHHYKKIDGVWKLAGVCPRVYWNEFNFEKIFPRLSALH
jgi:scytalone dehydratase